MNSLINAFNCKLYKFRDTHVVGSLQVFEQPCIGYINSGKAQFLYKGKSYYAVSYTHLDVYKRQYFGLGGLTAICPCLRKTR